MEWFDDFLAEQILWNKLELNVVWRLPGIGHLFQITWQKGGGRREEGH